MFFQPGAHVNVKVVGKREQMTTAAFQGAVWWCVHTRETHHAVQSGSPALAGGDLRYYVRLVCWGLFLF